MQLIYPTKKPFITQYYGNKNPLYKTSHNGVDFRIKNDPEREVFAAASGQVVRVNKGVRPFFIYSNGRWKRTVDYGKGSYYGNEIVIRHEQDGKEFYTRYGHNEETYVKLGDQVEVGELIAKGGNTGYSQGAHLHFMTDWILDKHSFDPFPFFVENLEDIPLEEEDEAREWVMKHEISNGERPLDSCTRQEVWVMMKRLAERMKEWNKK